MILAQIRHDVPTTIPTSSALTRANRPESEINGVKETTEERKVISKLNTCRISTVSQPRLITFLIFSGRATWQGGPRGGRLTNYTKYAAPRHRTAEEAPGKKSNSTSRDLLYYLKNNTLPDSSKNLGDTRSFSALNAKTYLFERVPLEVIPTLTGNFIRNVKLGDALIAEGPASRWRSAMIVESRVEAWGFKGNLSAAGAELSN
ncbi:hypothetical protein KM043_006536 [Ampulex compressa]|nr:hypothetical protein KM043_006536 [Ampulex compressa]